MIGTYKLTCNTCKMSYIGQTSRNLNQRYREHICYIRNNDPQSAYAQHILQNLQEYRSITDTMSLLKSIHKMPMLNLNLEEILSHGNEKFNYFFIIINVYYNYIINVCCKYYTSNKGLHKACGKEENIAVTGGHYYLLFEKQVVKSSVQCHVFTQSPPHRRPQR